MSHEPSIPNTPSSVGISPQQALPQQQQPAKPIYDYKQQNYTNATVHNSVQDHIPLQNQQQQQQSQQQLLSQQPTSSPTTAELSYQHIVTPPTPLPSDKIERTDDLNSRNTNTIRRNSKQVAGESPSYSFQQVSSEHSFIYLIDY